MSTYCRLCGESREISDLTCSIGDDSSEIKTICSYCADKLEKCWLFNETIAQAQIRLLEIFDEFASIKCEVNIEEENLTENIFVEPILVPTIQSGHDTESNDSRTLNNQSTSRTRKANSLNVHKEDKPLQCSECHRRFRRSSNLNKHMRQAHTRDTSERDKKRKSKDRLEKYKCMDCALTFGLKRAYTMHIKSHHINDSAGNSNETSAEHRNSNHQGVSHNQKSVKVERKVQPISSSLFECNQCDKRFQTQAGLLSHIANFNHSPNNNQYSCYLCKKKFKNMPLLKHHMAIHTLPNQFKCSYCNASFRTMRFYTHHQKKHVEYFCNICNKQYPSAFALKVHERMHVGSSTRMYGCTTCDHFFSDVSAYYNHMKRKHGMDSAAAKKVAKLVEPNGSTNPFVCEQCGKDFADNSRLTSHIETHSEERPFKCEFESCGKSFKNKYRLQTHHRIHTGENLFYCTEPDCHKKFSKKIFLERHAEDHTGNISKPFECDLCPKKFRTQFNYQNHRRTHTGEKPFKCLPCDHAVCSRAQLITHKKSQRHLSRVNELVNG